MSYVYSIDDIAAAAAANQRTLVYIHDKHTKFFTMLRVLATFLLLPSRFFSHCQCKYTQKFSVRMSLCVYLFRIVNAVSVLYFFLLADFLSTLFTLNSRSPFDLTKYNKMLAGTVCASESL